MKPLLLGSAPDGNWIPLLLAFIAFLLVLRGLYLLFVFLVKKAKALFRRLSH